MDSNSGYEALQVWNSEAISTAPLALKVWLGMMAITFLTSFIFVKKYNGPRAIAYSVFTGFLFTKLIAPKIGLIVYSGLVALTHVTLWPIGLIFLFRDRGNWSKSKLYQLWSYWVIVIMLISLAFDLRDAITYLRHI